MNWSSREQDESQIAMNLRYLNNAPKPPAKPPASMRAPVDAMARHPRIGADRQHGVFPDEVF
jgi:hypothetical protein